MKLVENEREVHRQMVQELLNRIAQPDRIIVDSTEPVEVEPSHDEAELAFIGREVPDGHTLGALRESG